MELDLHDTYEAQLEELADQQNVDPELMAVQMLQRAVSEQHQQLDLQMRHQDGGDAIRRARDNEP